MSSFAYTARSAAGETSQGVLAADSLRQARQMLRERGLFAVSLATAGREKARSQRKRVTRKDLLGLTSQLAIMTRAGIDVAGAIGSLAKQSVHPTLGPVLQQVHADVMNGKPVSAALKSHDRIFDQVYIATVMAGEASGRLPEVLDRLAKMLRAELRLRSQRRALLAYPIILSSVSLLVIFGLMFFVLPQFSAVFDQFGMKLPAITEFLLGISHELRARWWLWLVAGAAAIVGWKSFRRSETGTRFWDRLVLNFGPVRDVSRALITGRAFHLLGIMLDSGVPLLDGLKLTQSSLQNSLFRGLFEQLQQDVLNGRGLTEALAAAPFLPNGAVEMVSTAERTGSLGSVTQVIGEHYEEEGETRLRELAALVEPIIIVVMGTIVAAVVLAVMLPMFDFATLGQRGGGA